MMLRTLGLSATVLALGVNSILLPPTVSSADAETFNNLIIREKYQLVRLECPSCSAKPEGDFFTQEIDTSQSLLLNFSTGANPTTLELNGEVIYPPSLSSLSTSFHAFQIPSSVDPTSDLSAYTAQPLTITSYTFDASPAVIADRESEVEEVLKMHFQILALDGKPAALPSLELVTLKLATGELAVASIGIGAPMDRPMAPTVGHVDETSPECRNWPLLCHWRNVMADKLEKVRASWHKARPHRRPCHKGPVTHPGLHQPKPHPVDHHHGPKMGGHTGRIHGHHRHHRHGHWRHFWAMIFAHVVLPALIFGVPAAVTLFLIVHRIKQAKRARYARLAQEVEDEGEGEVVGGKKMEGYVAVEGDVEAGETPPVYSEKEVVE